MTHARIKYRSIKVRFSHFVFWGKPHELLDYGNVLVEEASTLLAEEARLSTSHTTQIDRITEDMRILRQVMERYETQITTATASGIHFTLSSCLTARLRQPETRN